MIREPFERYLESLMGDLFAINIPEVLKGKPEAEVPLARFIGWRVRRGVVMTGAKRDRGACALVEEWTALEQPISRDVEAALALTGASRCGRCGAIVYSADPLDRQRKPRPCPLCEVAR